MLVSVTIMVYHHQKSQLKKLIRGHDAYSPPATPIYPVGDHEGSEDGADDC